MPHDIMKASEMLNQKIFDFQSSCCTHNNNVDLPEFKYLNQDALEFLKLQRDSSIDLIITSPPYNLGKEYETRKSIDTYLNEFKPICRELVRVLSDKGSICWQVGNYIQKGKASSTKSEVFPLDIYYYLMFKEMGLKLRNRIIWKFGHGLQCKYRFSGRYETILWFTKSDAYTFNLDSVRVPSKYPAKKHYKGEHKGEYSCNPLGKNPEDVWTWERVVADWETLVWDIPNVKSNHPEKTSHPCQFPIELCERCVLALTNEGDVVYDPFAGVASTLIAALKNGRKAIGTELELKYIEEGLKHIEQLRRGELKYRPIYQEVYKPDEKCKLAIMPEEFIKIAANYRKG